VPDTTIEPAALLPNRSTLSPARARLFAAALVQFGERGYHGVSVRDITDALGQKPGAIYAHVGSKQELLFELAKIGHIEHRDRIRAALEASAPDPVSQVIAVVTAHVMVHLDYPALARVTNHVDDVLAIRSEAEFMVLDVIERGRASGDFGVANTMLAVTAIAAMGVRAVEWWHPELSVSAAEVASTYAQYAVNLLR
jgi:AcrR family transcriptional regulator